MAADSDKASKAIETQIALLRSGHLSDFIINCGDKEWKVHRSVICPYVIRNGLHSLRFVDVFIVTQAIEVLCSSLQGRIPSIDPCRKAHD